MLQEKAKWAPKMNTPGNDANSKGTHMNNPRYVIRAGELQDATFTLNLTPERAGWDWSALRILTLPAGASVEVPGNEIEYLVLPLKVLMGS